MNAITFGHVYRSATQARFSHTAVGCNQNTQPISVQFGEKPLFHYDPRPKKPMSNGEKIFWAVVGLAAAIAYGVTH